MNELVITTAEALPRVYAREGTVFASSRDVAACFGKRHDNVLRDIDALIDGLAGSSNLRGLFVERSEYHDKARKDVRFFDMTRDGFTLLAMGYTGKTALALPPPTFWPDPALKLHRTEVPYPRMGPRLPARSWILGRGTLFRRPAPCSIAPIGERGNARL